MTNFLLKYWDLYSMLLIELLKFPSKMILFYGLTTFYCSDFMSLFAIARKVSLELEKI